MIATVLLDEIATPTRRWRTINHEAVDQLRESIERDGLLQPLGIRKNPDPYAKHTYLLVYGLHRLEALRWLGMESAPCAVLKVDETQAEILELTENLVRIELTAAQRGTQTARLNKLLRVQPERRGESGLFESSSPAGHNDPPDMTRREAPPGGSTETSEVDHPTRAKIAEATGRSESTVKRDLEVGEFLDRLDEYDRDLISRSPLADRQKELRALAKLTKEQREAALTQLEEDEPEWPHKTVAQLLKANTEEEQTQAAVPKDDHGTEIPKVHRGAWEILQRRYLKLADEVQRLNREQKRLRTEACKAWGFDPRQGRHNPDIPGRLLEELRGHDPVGQSLQSARTSLDKQTPALVCRTCTGTGKKVGKQPKNTTALWCAWCHGRGFIDRAQAATQAR